MLGTTAFASAAYSPAVQFSQLDPAIGACQTAPGGGAFNCGDFSLGFAFTAQQDLLVGALGVFASGGVLQAAHEVILYSASGTPLVSASVDNSGSLQGFFRYADLQTPYALSAGQQYVLATYYAPGVDFYARDPLDPSFFGIGFVENRGEAGHRFSVHGRGHVSGIPVRLVRPQHAGRNLDQRGVHRLRAVAGRTAVACVRVERTAGVEHAQVEALLIGLVLREHREMKK